MARNRNSHETRKKILEVSKNLFLEKGFDNTSIQDIIDGLGGLTKGVIYHHFESKYDILQTIISENNQEILNYFCQFLSFYLPYFDYFICNICYCFLVAIDYN